MAVAMRAGGVRSAMREKAAGAVTAMVKPSSARPTSSSSYEFALPMATVSER